MVTRGLSQLVTDGPAVTGLDADPIVGGTNQLRGELQAVAQF